MKKTVLIPTDFSVDSLNTLKVFLNNYIDKSTIYDIILLHGYDLPTGIQSLLFFSKEKTLGSLKGEDFREACMMIENTFASKINSIQTDLFTGFNHAAFNHYIEANSVSEICFNSSIHLKETSKNSFDLTKFINKSTVKLIDIVGIAEIKNSDEKRAYPAFTNSVVAN